MASILIMDRNVISMERASHRNNIGFLAPSVLTPTRNLPLHCIAERLIIGVSASHYCPTLDFIVILIVIRP